MSDTDYDVVWHGGMSNDPLGGFTKGCLIEPREQTEDERWKQATGARDIGMTHVDLEAAVHRLNASLKTPVDFGKGLAA